MFTDLKNKKIYNYHLTIGAILGLVTIIYAAIWIHENILFHIINGLIAFVTGYCFHRFRLWRGGDAKLFTLYAFLMPPLGHDNAPFSSAINLFACSFIIGASILTLTSIKDITSNYNAMINELLPPKKRKDLVRNIGTTVYLSWIIFPVYYFTSTIHNPIVSLMITYLIFNFAPHLAKNYIIEILGIIFGFLIRFWLAPDYLSWQALIHFILRAGLWSTVSAFVHTLLGHFRKYHDRVPFAPLLFLGCVLSYTPFLTWVTHLTRR